MAKIILIDDTALLLEACKEMLQDFGHEVIDFPDGLKALEAIESGLTADLILSDYDMPGMNGMELLMRIRTSKNNSDARFALWSSRYDSKEGGSLSEAASNFGAKFFYKDVSKIRTILSEALS